MPATARFARCLVDRVAQPLADLALRRFRVSCFTLSKTCCGLTACLLAADLTYKALT